MFTANELAEYSEELRNQVCSRCIERQPGNPPCTIHGRPCGIEAHLPELVDVCRRTDSIQIDPYIQQLHDLICPECGFKDSANCPCPLDYLLPLAVEAVETVEQHCKLD
jgi:hypothetical protein